MALKRSDADGALERDADGVGTAFRAGVVIGSFIHQVYPSVSSASIFL
jgi:hypothetical protein